ncbi:hypothetical protein [Streptococcus suis]|uniref:hypothetical protein n=1 Tax=Streptococcus suis TaxID=1307 RepID=UPI00163A67F9|nr:hypothetical protein [Streptococcus suis]
MANEQNLIVPSSDEARKNGKKGGIASGKARRKKSNLKKAFETILQADVTSSVAKKQLSNVGVTDEYVAFDYFGKSTNQEKGGVFFLDNIAGWSASAVLLQ